MGNWILPSRWSFSDYPNDCVLRESEKVPWQGCEDGNPDVGQAGEAQVGEACAQHADCANGLFCFSLVGPFSQVIEF